MTSPSVSCRVVVIVVVVFLVVIIIFVVVVVVIVVVVIIGVVVVSWSSFLQRLSTNSTYRVAQKSENIS